MTNTPPFLAVTRCCDKLANTISKFDYGVMLIFLMTFAMMGVGIYGSLYLRYETTLVGPIMLHTHAGASNASPSSRVE